MKKKCRVFTTSLGWSEVMFIFDEDTKFSEITDNPKTQMLSRDDYVGTYEFDKKFIQFFNKEKIGDKYYFFRFSYHKDQATPEERQWKKMPEFEPKETKSKEHKNIVVKPGQVDAGDFKSLF
jgi:hypothetical protein